MWKTNFRSVKLNNEFIDKLANTYLDGIRKPTLLEILGEIRYSSEAGGRTLKEVLDEIIEMELFS